MYKPNKRQAIERTFIMTKIQELIENADNAYYATEYDKAIQSYMQALELDPDNLHAQQQLRKAERSRPSKSVKPETVPSEALQLYKRSRSFITIGDLDGAKQLLNQAIDITDKAGIDFPKAKDLVKNLQNISKAEEFKKKAFEELDTQQWGKARANLGFAVDLDPNDDTVQLLLSHLQSLIKAQNLVTQLQSGVGGAKIRSKNTKEVREILESTNETSALSTLWQEIARNAGDYNKVSFPQELISITTILVISSGIVGSLSALYYWSIGAYIALAMLAVTFILLISALSRK